MLRRTTPPIYTQPSSAGTAIRDIVELRAQLRALEPQLAARAKHQRDPHSYIAGIVDAFEGIATLLDLQEEGLGAGEGPQPQTAAEVTIGDVADALRRALRTVLDLLTESDADDWVAEGTLDVHSYETITRAAANIALALETLESIPADGEAPTTASTSDEPEVR